MKGIGLDSLGGPFQSDMHLTVISCQTNYWVIFPMSATLPYVSQEKQHFLQVLGV